MHRGRLLVATSAALGFMPLDASAHDSAALIGALAMVMALPVPPILVLTWRRWGWTLIAVIATWVAGYIILEYESTVLRSVWASMPSGGLTVAMFLALYPITAIWWLVRRVRGRQSAA